MIECLNYFKTCKVYNTIDLASVQFVGISVSVIDVKSFYHYFYVTNSISLLELMFSNLTVSTV